MTEYLGEGRSPLRGDRPKKPSLDIGSRHVAPKGASQKRKPSQRSDSMKRFISDFKNGLSTLSSAIDRVLQFRKFSGNTVLVEPRHSVEREIQTTITVPQVLEREIVTAKQAEAKILRDNSRPNRVAPDYDNGMAKAAKTYEKDASEAVKLGIPQFLAGILRAEPSVRKATPRSSTALRPVRGNAVEALMKVSRAIDAGRLPYVPKKTRKKAQELLDAVYKQNKGSPTTWGGDVAKLVEKHRLIPVAANTTENFRHTVASIPLPPQHKAAAPAKLTEQEAQKLESHLPRFRDEGSMASGPGIIDAGETAKNLGGLTTVYRDNSSHVSSYEKSDAPPPRDTATIATPPSHKSPPAELVEGGGRSGSLGAASGASVAGASSGSLRLEESTLTLEGFPEWVAKIEGKLKDAKGL